GDGSYICEVDTHGVDAFYSDGDAAFGGAIFANGIYDQKGIMTPNLSVSGDKNFVAPHPTDPEKEIVFTPLQGPESGPYFRGSGRIEHGQATIEVPEAFRLSSSKTGLTVVAMPMGEPADLVCIKKGLDTIVIQGSRDVEFDYVVNGVRKGFEHHQ